MKTKRKHAFTLTELLVVVVVIGVLAAVMVPKFSKIIETRKTSEAEEMMTAVRMEQEKRCLLNRPYTQEFAKLGETVPGGTGKHFTYDLEQGGMIATSRGNFNYNLRMPSYADGRICCEGDECNRLNKDYPSCDELVHRADFTEDESCLDSYTPPTPPEPDPEPETCPDDGEPTELPCGCREEGIKTRTCNDGAWSGWGECSAPQECSCEGEAPTEQESCVPDGFTANCGQRTRTATCDPSTGEWTWAGAEFGECMQGACECTADEYSTDGCHGQQVNTHPCNTETGMWEEWTGCDARNCVPGSVYEEACNWGGQYEPGCGRKTHTCLNTGKWKSGTCKDDARQCCKTSELAANQRAGCYYCEPLAGITPLDPGGLGFGAVPVEQNGNRFSFYYAVGTVETCHTYTPSSLPTDLNAAGLQCDGLRLVGNKYRCEDRQWQIDSRPCSQLFPRWCGTRPA